MTRVRHRPAHDLASRDTVVSVVAVRVPVISWCLGRGSASVPFLPGLRPGRRPCRTRPGCEWDTDGKRPRQDPDSDCPDFGCTYNIAVAAFYEATDGPPDFVAAVELECILHNMCMAYRCALIFLPDACKKKAPQHSQASRVPRL